MTSTPPPGRRQRPPAAVSVLATLLGLVTVVGVLAGSPSTAAAYDVPPEGYAPYQPQTRCPRSALAKPGTRALARWIDEKYAGGPALATKRGCGPGTSEHKDGRAIDWMMDAGSRAHRLEVRRFLDKAFRTNATGYEHAVARRMGIMYVIWNDRMWASYDRFEEKAYSGSVRCRATRTCTKTTRHRDHVHISLSRPGGRGATSWYTRRR